MMERTGVDHRWLALFILGIVVAAFVGCDPKELRGMVKLADEMCECKTVACADAVFRKLERVHTSAYNAIYEPGLAKRYGREVARTQNCYETVHKNSRVQASAARALSGSAAATGSGAAAASGAAVGRRASAQVHLAELISTDAIGVQGAPRELSPIVAIAGKFGEISDCVPKIVQRIATAYLVSVPQDGYSILEGDLPRPMLEACVSKVFGDSTFENDGEMVAFKTPMGARHVAWRGGFVIVGTRAQVHGALHTPTKETVARWRELLDPLARLPMWVVRIDRSMDDLFGGAPTSYEIVFDKMEKTPKPFFAGVTRIRYASPAEAERGTRFIQGWIQRGRFPRRIQAPPEIIAGFDGMVRAMQKLKIAQTGATLEMRFDTDMFGGPEKMGESMSRMAGQVGSWKRPAP